MEENIIGQNQQGEEESAASISNEESEQKVFVPTPVSQSEIPDSVSQIPAPKPLVIKENEEQQVPVSGVDQIPVASTDSVILEKTEPVAQNPMQAVETAKETSGSGKNVLLVEDDAFLNSLMKTKLERSGISVNLVTDGEEALKILETFKPDLILLDLILPKKSGFEVLESIQASPQLNKMPVIILSNLGQESDVSKGRQLGAVEYFVKAKTSIDELVSKVAEFLQGKSESLS
ncbi:MAG: response regulator [Candidatus Pacebacteria bacterium]|nr:response regulator [Candidatus Paceibacterota bacterium]